jgi:hypothetical protein
MYEIKLISVKIGMLFSEAKEIETRNNSLVMVRKIINEFKNKN